MSEPYSDLARMAAAAPPVESAGLDALDRGVIEAGVTAAEALARVERLERKVAALLRGIAEINEDVALPSEQFREAEREADRSVRAARRERIERLGLSLVGGSEAP